MLLVVALLGSAASAQSLGEAARQVRKKKSAPSPAQKVYTNENLPTSAPISIMSGSGVDTAAAEEKKGEAATKASGAPAAASADDKKNQDEWRTRFAEQKNKIQLLERELQVLQREQQIQVAVFYADAGTRLRDDRRFAEQDRKSRSDIETKQKQVADAKQQLEDMREQARKAGLPASVAE
jgi:hypothetical protein